MAHAYPWVPWFRELAENIAEGGEAYLSDRAQRVDWGKEDHALLKYAGENGENIDPFSFFYSLAQRNTRNFLDRVYGSVHEVFELSSEVPSRKSEKANTFPTPTSNTLSCFFAGETGDFRPKLLWELFRQAVGDDASEIEIDSQVFRGVLDIKNVGLYKLTQVFHLINPHYFLPIDGSTEVWSMPGLSSAAIERRIEEKGYDEYASIISEIKNTFPGCEPYEINSFLFSQAQKQGSLGLIGADSKFFHVSTHAYGDGDKEDDHWEVVDDDDRLSFKENSYVYTGGPGPEGGTAYPLTEANRGDVILVRTGITVGRAIGIVQSNEYQERGGFSEDAVIHVIWINKSWAKLLSHTGQQLFTYRRGFAKAERASRTYSAFRNTNEYKVSFDLIEKLRENSNSDTTTDDHEAPQQRESDMRFPLNVILYGPPGTGKTYATRRRCVDICDNPVKRSDEAVPARYKELRKKGRIEFVTFHQSYGYEEFVEGLRPVPNEGGAGFSLEPEDGVLKCIAKRARECEERLPYVLVIDEINRANISKVLGELVTLLEEDKRKGAKHELEVTLPYSRKRFTLPANLHILGTMNTADRSIDLLDTALRRRFDFEEMAPQPELLEPVDGIDLAAVLQTINRRLEYLLDRDQLIGHAWFMGARSKADVDHIMRNRIVPLIAEYFYEDWSKVRAVLGGGNDFVVGDKLDKPPGLKDDSDEPRYRWMPRKEFEADAYRRLVAGSDQPPETGGE